MKGFCFTVLLLVVLPAHAQRFGGAVAVSNDFVLVGETGNVNFPGEVYVYHRSDNWEAPVKLRVSEEADRFGRSLAAEGQLVLAGASAADASAGAVYVLTYDEAWSNVARLDASDGQSGDEFGTSVALSGLTALIGAPGKSERAGVAYVFERGSDGTFEQVQILAAEDLAPNDMFGVSVSVEGDLAAIGAWQQSEAVGAVYVYQRTDGVWRPAGKLAPGLLTERSQFGTSVLVHGGRVFASAPLFSRVRGVVLEYGLDAESGEWQMISRLGPFEMRNQARFGASLAAFGNRFWVGAIRGEGGVGTVYELEREGDAWTSSRKLRVDGDHGPIAFGSAVAVGESVAVVGATSMDSGEGAAAILEADGAQWVQSALVINDIKGFDAITGGMRRCDAGAVDAWPCQDVDLTAFVPTKEMGGSRGTRVNDLWGWTDSQTGREYALVGRNNGTSFVDVTDPELPVYIGDLPMTDGSRPNVWRDIKVYADHAYVVADGAGEHGVQVFDLTQLRAVTAPPVMFEETAHYSGIYSAHNIVINEATGFGYVVGASGGGETCGGGLHMIDLRNTPDVTFAGCFADPDTGRRGTGYSHDAQCVIYRGPDIDYQGREICLGSNETAISISDVTDKANPVAISMAVYPNVAYTHQGWLTEDHRYFYMNDEGDEPQGLVEGTRTLVFDVSDLDDPILINEYIAQTTTTDHNLYVRGTLMYQSNYGSGLRILDISDPENPIEVGYFDTTPGQGSGSWSNYPYFESGTLIVTSGQEGLFVLRKRNVDL